MDVGKILAELRLEREQLEDAIASLERLEMPKKRRGRPPAWLAELRRVRETRKPEADGHGKKKSPRDSAGTD